MNCRFCGTPLEDVFLDLVNAPPSNSFLSLDQLSGPETFFPLRLFACSECHLVQVDEYKSCEDIFCSEYVYFSSYSSTWLAHAKKFADKITERLDLGPESRVMEIASNDGYLLQFFKEKGIACLGIEPALATAQVARSKGIEVMTEFFGADLGGKFRNQGRQADLLVGNNVLAHVPDINDFVAGLQLALAPTGTITMEFPHLLRLVQDNQFDTVYHEHFSYLSFHTVDKIFHKHGLIIYDVEELPTHGGSLRIYAAQTAAGRTRTQNVLDMLEMENEMGMFEMDYYRGFQSRADKVKYALLKFLVDAKIQGKKVVAYGAAAKGNTLLNYCGIKNDLIAFVADKSEHKQGLFTPGSHVPVVPPSSIEECKPEYILILPWNIKDEILEQLRIVRSWGGKFVLAIPELTIVE